MKTIWFLLRKEFRQIFRNPNILRIILIMPVFQLLLLPMAADYEIKNINIAIVDLDHTPESRQLKHQILASSYFRPTPAVSDYKAALEQLELDQADLILVIPQAYARGLYTNKPEALFVNVNAINGTKALIGANYLNLILREAVLGFARQNTPEPRFSPIPTIEITTSFWFNRNLEYPPFMVPGILVILVTMIGSYLSALNIVIEKEQGTIEQINVTPIHPYQFILGKVIPFWIVGILVFTIGLFGIARWVYGIVPVGSLGTLYAFVCLYVVTVTGLGMILSIYANTQQQAMSLTFFFMVVFILMSGLFTPFNSMPLWAQWMGYLSPVTWFNEVMRMVVLKGSGFVDIRQHFLVILGFGIFYNAWAIILYRKTS
jgi:ABC-2 type transport system permease protein